MKKINYMDIKEFREKGYLQEANRRFFHPLGLALYIEQNDGNRFKVFFYYLKIALKHLFNTETEIIAGVWDYREDPEGNIFDYKNSDNERIKNSIKKSNYIDGEIRTRIEIRTALFGYTNVFSGSEIEPINPLKNKI